MMEDFFVRISQKIIDQFNQMDYFWPKLDLRLSRPGYQPSGFIISITTRCNFNCPHCLRSEVDKNKSLVKDLPVPVFKTVLKEGKKINFQFVSLTGGEPILHPYFRKVISLINQYNYKLFITSNGWLYKEYWEVIKQNPRNKTIFLSVDGTTAEVHDTIRDKQGSFERLIEAIEFYRGRRVPMIITFCVTKQNYHQIEKLPEFCLKHGIKFIKWITVFPVIKNSSGIDSINNVLTDSERREALQKIFNLQEKFKGRCAFLITSSFFSVSRILNNGLDKNRIDFCPALNGSAFYIDHDGGMLFCCDLRRECRNKPLVQNFGFEKSLKITLDVANEIKKKFLDNLLNSSQKITRICEFCNDNVESCLELVTEQHNKFLSG